jgi:hypothetical protein
MNQLRKPLKKKRNQNLNSKNSVYSNGSKDSNYSNGSKHSNYSNYSNYSKDLTITA